MKRKLIFGAMMICLLALGLNLIGCPTESGGEVNNETGNNNTPILAGTIWKYTGSSQDKQLEFSQTTVSFKEIRGGSYSVNGTYTITEKT
jgi:hypothetical protein